MGYALARPRGSFWRSRGGVLVGIVALHGFAAALFMNAGLRQKVEAVVTPVQVSFLEEARTEEAPKPPPPKLVQIKPIDLVLPIVDTPATEATQSITVIAAPATPPAPTVVASGDVPLSVERVDYMLPPVPKYPPAAKRARVQGIVLLRVVIDTEGRPREVRVHKTSGSQQLDFAARESVLAAMFKPYRENGVPRSAQVIIPIQFSLTIRTASRGDRDDGEREFDPEIDRPRGRDHDRGFDRGRGPDHERGKDRGPPRHDRD